MKLDEIFQEVYSYEWINETTAFIHVTSTYGIKVVFMRNSSDVVREFFTTSEEHVPSFTIAFTSFLTPGVNVKREKSEYYRFKAESNPIKVFSSIYKVVVEFVQQHPDSIYKFVAADEKRLRIYMNLIKRLVKQFPRFQIHRKDNFVMAVPG